MAAMGTAEIPPCPSAEAPAPPAEALAPPSGSRGAPRKRLRVDWATKLAAALPPEGSPAAGGAACASTAVAEPEDRAHGGVGGSYEPALVGLGDLATLAPALPRCCSVALATCMRGCPAARLREWLFWHLSHGVRPIFLRWEGPLSAAQSAELAGPRERGDVVLRVVPSVGHLSSGFNSVMARQVKFVHRCLAEARHLGCDFLLHLDDDELLCPIRGSLSIPDVLGLHCRSTARCIHFENWEAVMPFAEATSRPFSRTGVEFRTRAQVLYCNGKSAANLTAPGSVYCSGVHHFCRYDRTFSEICVARYGLHDKAEGCCHPSCCAREAGAVVLHYDSPSFQEWRCKFAARAASKMCGEDEDEMKTFPFKEESVQVLQKMGGSEPKAVAAQKRVYRSWRCLPGRSEDVFDARLSGVDVCARFEARLREARGEPPGGSGAPAAGA